jgi:hypothetical protein
MPFTIQHYVKAPALQRRLKHIFKPNFSRTLWCLPFSAESMHSLFQVQPDRGWAWLGCERAKSPITESLKPIQQAVADDTYPVIRFCLLYIFYLL